MRKFLRWLIFFILPLVIIGGVAILESLSTSKMGVNRYLLYKKIHYAETIFTPEKLKWYLILLIIGILICLFLFIKKSSKRLAKRVLLYLTIYQAAGIALLSSQSLNAYPLFAIGILSIILLQYSWLIWDRGHSSHFRKQ
ncbi:hypothetical protein [Bacillus tuaregi]|uniref:hypothetical protein n=1 Tax=Bacillus tuaregi TaxID=1816695 RepID=UPI0008F8F1E3|nr:hypothetical protein [Bacillus tuaregi]